MVGGMAATRHRGGSEAENSQGEHEAEGANWKWGEPVNSDSLPPVMYFLSQGHTS